MFKFMSDLLMSSMLECCLDVFGPSFLASLSNIRFIWKASDRSTFRCKKTENLTSMALTIGI